ncbi:unnamed protein product [Triticum turgidum subsp. durum]|uniref:Uncharacterized protein n=1 Tax=Triticum turgidum subsp. durum TaxID=4567 RepID=A0A9R1QX99_TRITD|nr:unnamed protein product [Triticum turgidum subsp. durum]
MGVVGQQEVEVLESCMVKPSVETPSHGLWLSQLDLKMVNRGHTPNVYFYTPHSGAVGNFFDVARLKAAMAKALVPFYPLAGRLGVDDEGQPEIDCAGQGVLFVVARSDLTVDGFVDFQPSPELRRLFVPRVEDSPSIMCAIQVTFMGCGGVALGTALHHVAIDAVSAVHFFQTWSGFCRDGDAAAAVLELPCHDRTLLRARSPPVVHPDALTVFSCPKLSLAVSAEPSGAVVNKIFVLSKDQVRDIESEELGSVAHRISGAVGRMDDELVRSAIDYLEINGKSKQPPSSMPETELRVVSWLGMPVYDVDFGWGKPLVMHRAVQQRAGMVYLMDGVSGSGGVRILVSTEAVILNDFQRLLYANF